MNFEEALFNLFDRALGDVPAMTAEDAKEYIEAVFNVLETMPDKKMAANLAERIGDVFAKEEKIEPVIKRVIGFLKKMALESIGTPGS